MRERVQRQTAEQKERERQAKEASAATAAVPASKRYESLGAEDWAKMSKDEQLKAIFEINQDLDAEMGS